MRLLVNCTVMILSMIMSGFAYAAIEAPAKGKTIVWQGTVQVKKTFTVKKGNTLEIRPGSRIFFAKGVGLQVKGTLKAVGRKGEEIVFTTSRTGTPGRWHEIWFDSAGESIMEHCVIDSATWGMHSHFTQLKLNNCTIKNSEVGLRFQGGPVTISKCLFTENRIGLRSYKGIAQVSESDFTDNEIGIFVREKGGGLNITRCNLFRNSAYNIRIGDFNNEDVKASDNWWGQDNPSATIFDAGNEPGIGRVIFEPFRIERIVWQ